MDFRLPIRLKGVSGEETIRAEVVHISESGVYVIAPMMLATGSEVECGIGNEGEEIAVQGTVKWSHRTLDRHGEKGQKDGGREHTQTLVALGGGRPEKPRSRPSIQGGMGIGFRNLSAEDKRRLDELRERTAIQTTPARLRFFGIPGMVSARGYYTHDGLLLETRLPFLQIGSSVRLELMDSGACHEGKIVRAELDPNTEDNIPFLRVGLEIEPQAESTQRFYLLENVDTARGKPEEPESGLDEHFHKALQTDGHDSVKSGQNADGPIRSSVSPKSGLVVYAMIAVLAAATGAGTAWYFASPEPEQTYYPPDPMRADSQSGPEQTDVQPDPTRNDLRSEPEQTDIQPAPAPTDLRSEPVRADPRSEPAAAATRAEPVDESTTAGKAEDKTDGKEVDRATDSRDVPVVTVDNDTTRIFISATGSDENMQEYRLSTPGITFNLPRAQTPVPHGNYGIHQGLVRRLWIRPFKSGIQIRVITAWASVRHTARFSSKGLEIVLLP